MDIEEILYDWIIDKDLEDISWEDFTENIDLYMGRYFHQYQDWCETTALEMEE